MHVNFLGEKMINLPTTIITDKLISAFYDNINKISCDISKIKKKSLQKFLPWAMIIILDPYNIIFQIKVDT